VTSESGDGLQRADTQVLEELLEVIEQGCSSIGDPQALGGDSPTLGQSHSCHPTLFPNLFYLSTVSFFD
jgi:hypothetical protein